jgi:hypothetical protein
MWSQGGWMRIRLGQLINCGRKGERTVVGSNANVTCDMMDPEYGRQCDSDGVFSASKGGAVSGIHAGTRPPAHEVISG